MGFFDTIEDVYLTKALGRKMNDYFIGDAIPGPQTDYQLEISGKSYAVIKGGILTEITEKFDPNISLRDYYGNWHDAVSLDLEELVFKKLSEHINNIYSFDGQYYHTPCDCGEDVYDASLDIVKEKFIKHVAHEVVKGLNV